MASVLDLGAGDLSFAGELVVRDLYGEMSGASESSIHSVVIPFSRSSASIALGLPELVEGS